MGVVNALTLAEILELKASIGDLESTVLNVYKDRMPRNLTGAEGILIRTLGTNYSDSSLRNPKYFDSRRNAEVDTEFSEFVESLSIYDLNPIRENEIELLLEAGDVLFQKKVVELKHGDDENYSFVMVQFNSALDYIKRELELREFSFDRVKKFTEIKYGSRVWLNINGYHPKDKELEKRLCFEAYND